MHSPLNVQHPVHMLLLLPVGQHKHSLVFCPLVTDPHKRKWQRAGALQLRPSHHQPPSHPHSACRT
jgi:hypothetical protein